MITSPADIIVLGGSNWLTLRARLDSVWADDCLCGYAAALGANVAGERCASRPGIIRARLENELQLETKHRRLFERNLAAVFLWRPDGAIVDCNMAFVKMPRVFQLRRADWAVVTGILKSTPRKRENLCATLQQEAVEQSRGEPAAARWGDGSSVDEYHSGGDLGRHHL